MLSQLFKYGAINGKIHAMLGARLSASDFDKLINMQSVPDVAGYLLQNNSYKSCLSGIDCAQVRRAELEHCLHLGIQKEYARLAAFSTKELRALLRALLQKAEAAEILRFLRFLSAGHPQDFSVSLPPQILEKSHVRYSALASSPTFDGLLQATHGSIFHAPLCKIVTSDNEEFPYLACETAVQSAYYSSIFTIIANFFASDERTALTDFFKKQCDFSNITRIIRIKQHFKIDSSVLLGYLLPFSYKLKGDYLSALVNSVSFDSAIDILKTQGPYSKIFGATNEKSIESYQFKFFGEGRHLLRNGKPSVFTAITYLDLKETELNNIINIIECVRYDVPKNLIPAYLAPIY